MSEKPTYKLRFPLTGPGVAKYLLFSVSGALLIETQDSTRLSEHVYERIEPEDTIRFLEAIGESERRPEFVDGDPTPQTKAMLRRIIKQFNSCDDLHKCWQHIGIRQRLIKAD